MGMGEMFGSVETGDMLSCCAAALLGEPLELVGDAKRPTGAFTRAPKVAAVGAKGDSRAELRVG